jgi:hypothetical protein
MTLAKESSLVNKAAPDRLTLVQREAFIVDMECSRQMGMCCLNVRNRSRGGRLYGAVGCFG